MGPVLAVPPATLALQPTPVRVDGLDGVTDVCSGGAHNLAIREDGALWTWGRDDHGQLGDGDAIRPGRAVLEYAAHSFPVRPVPALVQGARGVAGIGAGGGHSFAVLADHTLLAYAFNRVWQRSWAVPRDPSQCVRCHQMVRDPGDI